MKQVSIIKAVKIKNQRIKPFDGEREYLATGGLVKDKIKTETLTYLTKPSRADLLVFENQLIVARMKGTNKVLLVDKNSRDLIVSTGFLVLEVQEGWHPRFLFHYFVSSYFQEQKDRLSIGATQKAINNSKFKEILIPDLSFEEQKRIVKILDRADAICKKRKQAIDLLDDYVKSIFLEIFGDPVKNPKKWEIKTIEQLVKKEKYSLKRGPFGGALKKEIFVKSGYLVYEQFHALNNDFTMERYFIDEKKFNELKAFEVKAGDIIISCSGVYLGKLAIIPKDYKKGIINQALLKVGLDNTKINNLLFIYIFSNKNFKNKFFGNKIGSGIPNFPAMAEFKKFSFICPPIELQNRFALIVEKNKLLKTKMLIQFKDIEAQFQVLMQKAFKGEF